MGPSRPKVERPYKLYPMVNVLKRVPKTAKVIIDAKLSKNALSKRANAESRMIGGSRTLKKRSAVNFGKEVSPEFSMWRMSSRMT